MNGADNSFWGRPVYMLQLPDGSLLLVLGTGMACHGPRGNSQIATTPSLADLAHYLADLRK